VLRETDYERIGILFDDQDRDKSNHLEQDPSAQTVSHLLFITDGYTDMATDPSGYCSRGFDSQ